MLARGRRGFLAPRHHSVHGDSGRGGSGALVDFSPGVETVCDGRRSLRQASQASLVTLKAKKGVASVGRFLSRPTALLTIQPV